MFCFVIFVGHKQKTNAMKKELILSDYRSENYDANIERYGDYVNTCFLCGKRTASGAYVHYTNNDTLTDEIKHPDSEGLFPVGIECAKKLPKSFIFNM